MSAGSTAIGFGAANVAAATAAIKALYDSVKTQQAGIKAVQIGQEANRVATEASIAGSLQAGKSAAYQVAVETENRARAAEAKAKTDGFNVVMLGQQAESEMERAGVAATDFRREVAGKAAKREAAVGASNLTGQSRQAVSEAIRTEGEYGAQRLISDGALVASRLRTQAQITSMNQKANLDTAFFAREAGAQSQDNIMMAARIQAAGAAAKGQAVNAELEAKIATINTGIQTTYAAAANASVTTAKNAYDTVVSPLSTLIGSKAKDWGLTSSSPAETDWNNYSYGQSADIGGLAW